jgi:glycosyltransferase involved in cell wall biosynthesis
MSTRLSPVTVIVPAYNSAGTLDRAIKSVLNQTTPPAEIIVVDDASTDDTLETLEGLFATKPGGMYTKIICLPTNGGAGKARNEAWLHATQPYVAFLDADDSWHPRKLEVQYEWMKANPGAKISAHKCELETTKPNVDRSVIAKTHIPYRFITLYRFFLGNPVSTPTVMLARSISFRFSPRKRYAEDYLLWAQIVQSHHKLAFLDVTLAYLHKPKYGSSGLSAELINMERGEIDALVKIYGSSKKRKLDFFLLTLSLAFSICKFLYRFSIVFIKKFCGL